jgi:hypothetical protein
VIIRCLPSYRTRGSTLAGHRKRIFHHPEAPA